MAWTPTTADVAAILPTRTTVDGGELALDFNANTTPSGNAVESLIARGMGDVASKVGAIPDGGLGPTELLIENGAKTAATYRAAMLTELTFFPEQINDDRLSPYSELKALYAEALINLESALIEWKQGGEIEAGGNNIADPSYGFPEDEGGMVGWGTAW